MSVTATSSDGMRQRAEWMAPKDDPILEVLRDIGKQWASDRCRALWKHGLLVMIEDGLYAISEDGIAYLDEELDAATLEELDEGPIADE